MHLPNDATSLQIKLAAKSGRAAIQDRHDDDALGRLARTPHTHDSQVGDEIASCEDARVVSNPTLASIRRLATSIRSTATL
jgi:hypothetical protein